MSTLTACAATVHFPYVTGWPERATTADRDQTLQGFVRLGLAFREAGVETMIVFTSEHIVNLQPRLAPAFTIGLGARHETFPEPYFNLPADDLRGDPEVADTLVHALYASGFDAAHATGIRLDHGTVLPLHLMGLRDLAIVPIVINSIFRPLPTLARCRALGEAVATALAHAPIARNVGLLATGGISHTVGGPRVDENDPVFDRQVLDSIVAGRLDEVCAFDDEQLEAAGNGTHEIRNWIALAAAAGERRPEVVTAIAFARGWNSGVHQLMWSKA